MMILTVFWSWPKCNPKGVLGNHLISGSRAFLWQASAVLKITIAKVWSRLCPWWYWTAQKMSSSEACWASSHILGHCVQSVGRILVLLRGAGFHSGPSAKEVFSWVGVLRVKPPTCQRHLTKTLDPPYSTLHWRKDLRILSGKSLFQLYQRQNKKVMQIATKRWTCILHWREALCKRHNWGLDMPQPWKRKPAQPIIVSLT